MICNHIGPELFDRHFLFPFRIVPLAFLLSCFGRVGCGDQPWVILKQSTSTVAHKLQVKSIAGAGAFNHSSPVALELVSQPPTSVRVRLLELGLLRQEEDSHVGERQQRRHRHRQRTVRHLAEQHRGHRHHAAVQRLIEQRQRCQQSAARSRVARVERSARYWS